MKQSALSHKLNFKIDPEIDKWQTHNKYICSESEPKYYQIIYI